MEDGNQLGAADQRWQIHLRPADGRPQKPERTDYHWTKGVTVSEMFVTKARRSDHRAVIADYKIS